MACILSRRVTRRDVFSISILMFIFIFQTVLGSIANTLACVFPQFPCPFLYLPVCSYSYFKQHVVLMLMLMLMRGLISACGAIF